MTALSDGQPRVPGQLLTGPFLRALGVHCVASADGRSEMALALDAEHLNNFAIAHGGVLMTLLDVAMASAARSLVNHQQGVVTIEMKTSFMLPARGAQLRAHGRCLHRTQTMAFCEADIVDEHGRIVARASGTFKYLKAAPRPDGDRTSPGELK